MSDGGYSRLEKDFLGNERMVHYDAEGNMLGASDVLREEDGTIRISNEPGATSSLEDLPKVEAVVPTPKAKAPEPIDVRVVAMGAKSDMQRSQVVTYSIGAFIAALLLTLGALALLRSNGSTARVQTNSQATAPYQSPPITNEVPDSPSRRENFPDEPRPRNDEQPGEPRPFDQTAPDSNMDDTRPRIQNNDPTPPDDNTVQVEPKPKKGGSDDPIDLRGDEGGKKDPPKKGDPGADPLRGDDIH